MSCFYRGICYFTLSAIFCLRELLWFTARVWELLLVTYLVRGCHNATRPVCPDHVCNPHVCGHRDLSETRQSRVYLHEEATDSGYAVHEHHR